MRRYSALAIVLLTLAIAGTASAKMRLSLTIGDRSPTVGQAVTVVVKTDLEPRFAAMMEMRVVKVPPGARLYEVLRNEGSRVVQLRWTGTGWRGTVRFSRPGAWRVVVPNWGAPGYAIPPPVVRWVSVSS